MNPAKPSLELLRALTDEHVLRALMREGRLTRAELATATGVSKPTAGESVRRLVAAGLVADTGERTPGGRGRGRVGSYYSLAPDIGLALAITIAPEGIVAESITPYGEVISRAEQPSARLAHPGQVAAALPPPGRRPPPPPPPAKPWPSPAHHPYLRLAPAHHPGPRLAPAHHPGPRLT